MFRKPIFTKTLAAVLLVGMTSLPLFAARGSANFTRYVALGDSYGAGVSNGSLVMTHQVWSYPAVIARQAHAPDFQQPLVSQPGIGPELQLVSLIPLQILPKATGNGVPINLSLPRPYNNLSIPGARAIDLTTLNGTDPATSTAKATAQFILRGIGTATQQAALLNPTFITVWIGGNDVLGAVLAGTPAVMTPIADFTAAYTAVLDQLIAGAPNAGMVTAGVPDATLLPYARTIPPVLVNPATQQPVPGPDGHPIFLVADLGGGAIGQLTTNDLVLLPASALIATGYGIPAVLAPAFPTLPNVGKPLPDTVVLSAAEIKAIQDRAAEVNAAIKSAAAAKDIPFVELNPILNELTQGKEFAGVEISTSFLTGGFFSYDGFHPTDLGYILIANEFIKVINAAYGSRIPLASIVQLFANNAPSESASSVYLYQGMPFDFTLLSWANLMSISGFDPEVSAPEAQPTRATDEF